MNPSKPFPHLFSIDEANSLLPTLRPIMEAIFQNLDLLRRRGETVIRREGLTPDSPDLMERLKRDNSVVRAIQQVQDLVEKVQQFGCICKGIEQGLVDFPCLFGDGIVFLCWRYGEESVGYWHGLEDGFAGRRSLLDVDEMGGVSYH